MDERQRKLWRNWQKSGSADDLAAFIFSKKRAGEIPDVADEILEETARGFFVPAWSSYAEAGAITFGEQDLDIVAPETPADAIEHARRYLTEVQKATQMDINTYYHFVELLPRDRHWERGFSPSVFGRQLAHSAQGSGTGLWEIVAPPYRSAVEVPASEYVVDNIIAEISSLTEDLEQQQQVVGLINGTIDPESFESVENRLRQSFNRPDNDTLIMTALDEVLETHGIEAIEDQFGEIVATYLNTGETYVSTILHDNDGFQITSWGEYVNSLEQAEPDVYYDDIDEDY